MKSPIQPRKSKLHPRRLSQIEQSENVGNLIVVWIVGQSSVLNMTRSTGIAKLLSSLRKFGQYYRGCELLHSAIMNLVVSRRYQAFFVRHVPSSTPETHTTYPEWYRVVDLIYYRTRHRCITISPREVVEANPSINDCHNEWPTREFVRRAEVCLIDYLMQLGRCPTEVGVSKLCCRACYV